jgi:hypothetical protein
MGARTLKELTEKAAYKQHPYGKSRQPFDEETFADLVCNVDRRGLDKEITRYQEMVLEGWHRYLACLATNTKPRFVEFGGTDLEAAELVHASEIRRHSRPDQRYAAFDQLCDACPAFKAKYEQLKARGEQQQKEGKPLGTGARRVDVVGAKAEAAGVSKTTAKKVERVKKANPGAVADIAVGKTTANKEVAKLQNKAREASTLAQAPFNGAAEPAAKDVSARHKKAKGERPKIADLVGIVHRGLAEAKEAEGLALRGDAVFFRVNGYRVKVTCQIV